MNTDDLRNDGEVVVKLADGWTLRSGAVEFTSGDYVRLCDPEGGEYCYWDKAEWQADPALVMGAIINAAAGLRLERVEADLVPSDRPGHTPVGAWTEGTTAKVEAAYGQSMDELVAEAERGYDPAKMRPRVRPTPESDT